MENLPQDIALDIFSRLPILALVQTKCVCRTWRTLAEDPRLPIIYHGRGSTRDPCLILHCDSPLQNKLCYVSIDGDCPSQNRSRVRPIDARLKSIMAEYQVVGSCNGLLCVSDALYFNPIVICNPFAGNYVELAKAIQYRQQELVFGFGCNSTTMEYKVVRIVFRLGGSHSLASRWLRKPDVEVLTVGNDHTWRYLGSVPWRLNPGASEALLHDALHWVTMRYKHTPGPSLRIMSFSLARENFREIGLPGCGSLRVCNFHLVVLRGCLSAVHCLDDNKGMQIWIMKEYNVRESWRKDYVIGTYLPASLMENGRLHVEMLKKSGLGRGASQVICSLKNGEILLEYENQALVRYNPESEEFNDLMISDLPKWFSTIAQVESLFPVEPILGMQA